MASAIRALTMDAIEAARSGHPGMPMGFADVATVLFSRHLKFDPETPDWPDRDRFVLSAGHGSMLLYSLAYLTGYRAVTMDDIRKFRQFGSKTAGHPELDRDMGVEITTGPLGQGLASAVGMALAERVMNTRFGDALVSHYTYVAAGDGDLMEGLSHEACAFAGHLRLNRLIVLYDDNGITIDGPTDLAYSEDVCMRFQAYGWKSERIDGHDPDAIDAALTRARKSDLPSLICCRTTIGQGAPTKSGKAGIHGSPLGVEEIAATRKALDWQYPPFVVPQPILQAWRDAGSRSHDERTAWDERLSAADADARKAFRAAVAGDLPADFDRVIAQCKRDLAAGPAKQATRRSSASVLEALIPAIPELIGGSADLTESNGTKLEIEGQEIQAGAYGGRYIHYGIREHAMAAAMNGMALHGGVIPYGGSFFIFMDYCRAAVRLAALMRQRVIFVMSHDSIGLGEDGPTHQPVEQLSTLRAVPNVQVLRPADPVETVECWEIALRHRTGPTILCLTRQAVSFRAPDLTDGNRCEAGAYVYAEAGRDDRGGTPRIILIATGSEMEVALEARDRLEHDGYPTRIVSMPSWELFDRQDDAYRDAVLGGKVSDGKVLRIAVEAANAQGWERYIGPDGIFIGMTGYGVSAPYPDLYRHFGITADAVVAAAKARLTGK